jgi:hypothetical protein
MPGLPGCFGAVRTKRNGPPVVTGGPCEALQISALWDYELQPPKQQHFSPKQT